ncbi:MAG: hypothetical protein JST48_07090 [Bacteroidetes bacterium]|nr:hypothetical protein [Bacteroidota bacterium]
MKVKLLFVFVLVANFCQAQSGNYFISHYTPQDERFDYHTFAMAQGETGVIYFANKRGVLEFDGRNWGLITTPGPTLTIAAAGQDVFVGGYDGFGKLVIGNDNVKEYHSLSQNLPDATQIFACLSHNNKIYFANTKSVFILSLSGNVEATMKAKPNEGFEGLMEIAGKIFVKTVNGYYKIEDNKLVEPNFPWTDKLSIDFASSSDSSTPITLLCVEGTRFFLASSSGLKEINVSDKDFLIRNIPVNAAWLNDALVAVGTLHGGVIFINPQTGETKEITNYYTGLPDNEVYSMFADRNQGLWVAHDYGFSRVTPFIPFKSYSHYSGLEGNLLCAKTYQGKTYVGTTLGLYCLVQQEIDQEVKTGEKETKESSTKKGLISSSRNRVNSKKQDQPAKQIIKSTVYAYKKVEGISGKVSQLILADDQLLAVGDFGLAAVTNTKTDAVTFSPVHAAFKSKSLGQILVSTFKDEIKTYTYTANSWQETHLLDTIRDYVSYIFEDKLQNIWLCGRTNATKIETVDGGITAVERIPFSNPSFDESVGLAYGTEVYVATAGSFFRYDISKNHFEKYDSLPGPKKYFASAGYFWFHDGHRWRTVDPRMQAALKLQWLGLFSNIRFISLAEDESLWVITANNELYKFSGKQADQNPNGYPLFLREVRGQQNRLKPSRSIMVSQLESTVSFEFVQPDYLGMKAVEYRYQVKGQSSDWTPWSTSNNIVNFSYLPPGKYRLAVQTRDLMGKTSAVEEVTLEVEPPYWKRSWFYLLEVVVLGILVFLSIRLSAGNSKYKLLSQLLSMLTIILIIQFLSVTVNAFVTLKTSPVIDFFVQVGIALLVLPVENTLRKFIARGRLN